MIEPGGTAILEIEAVGGSFIDYIDIVRNGSVIRRITPEIEPSPIGTPDDWFETICVLELGWGERGMTHRWQGSIEILDGDLLAVEPRLRGAEIVSPLEGSATRSTRSGSR